MTSAATTYLSSDRLKLTLFLASLLHIVIILGIGFSRAERNFPTPQLEITLAQYQSSELVDNANFLAQWDQQGSGTEAEKSVLSSPQVAVFKSNKIQELDSSPQPSEYLQAADSSEIETLSEADKQTQRRDKTKEIPAPLVDSNNINPEIVQRLQSISSLEAQLDAQKQAYADIPRVHRVTSMSTRRSVDARYLHMWRNKIEAIGNRHYPEQSRRQGIYGNLRLLVAIRSDGSLKDIEVLSSSGHPVLDQAAVRIVRMAAPYAPFPKELRETTDILEIIRTWQFQQNRLSSR